jgi:hypothetical protein
MPALLRGRKNLIIEGLRIFKNGVDLAKKLRPRMSDVKNSKKLRNWSEYNKFFLKAFNF